MTTEPGFRKFSLKISVESLEEGEEFLQGLIVARTNNNSPLFPELIEGVNGALEPARKARLDAEVAAREAAGL